MKEIKLTNGGFTSVDDEDFEELNKYRWYWQVTQKGSSKYVLRTDTYILLHRFLLSPKKNELIDHKNMNGLDNRRTNLRICNKAENMRNRPVQKNNKSSQYKGVSFAKQRIKYGKPWNANINVFDKKYNLGYFKTELEAAKAYDKGAEKYFGEFAYYNLKENK